MTDFDLYRASRAVLGSDQLRGGQRIWLDGIDGFFDQYFEARKPGEVIRFLVYRYVLGSPVAGGQLAALPLVSATVVEADSTGGTVEVIEVRPFEAWLRALSPQSEVSIAELETSTNAPIGALVAEADRTGFAAWSASSKRWATLNQVTAVYLTRMSPERLRIAVLRTNAVPASVADIVTSDA